MLSACYYNETIGKKIVIKENKNLSKILEERINDSVNALGIGPQGFGGRTTALGVNIETLPTHIAGMPCAVNLSCHVTRHETEVI